MRKSWNVGNWGIVNKIYLKDNKEEQYCNNVTGFIQYSDGTKFNGSFPCYNTYAWRIIKVFDDENIEVVYPKCKKKE